MTRDAFAVTNEKEGGGAEITDLVGCRLDKPFPVVAPVVVVLLIIVEVLCLKSGCSLITSQTLFPSQRKLCLVGVVRT